MSQTSEDLKSIYAWLQNVYHSWFQRGVLQTWLLLATLQIVLLILWEAWDDERVFWRCPEDNGDVVFWRCPEDAEEVRCFWRWVEDDVVE